MYRIHIIYMSDWNFWDKMDKDSRDMIPTKSFQNELLIHGNRPEAAVWRSELLLLFCKPLCAFLDKNKVLFPWIQGTLLIWGRGLWNTSFSVETLREESIHCLSHFLWIKHQWHTSSTRNSSSSHPNIPWNINVKRNMFGHWWKSNAPFVIENAIMLIKERSFSFDTQLQIQKYRPSKVCNSKNLNLPIFCCSENSSTILNPSKN